jgi:hypothetical protein
MIENIVRFFAQLMTLQHPAFRRAVLIVIPVSVVAIWLFVPFAESINNDMGYKFANVGLILLMAVLVEHIATSVTRFRAVEDSVGELKTSITDIKTSIGVQEGIEVYQNDNNASRKQGEYIVNKKPRKLKFCEYSSGSVQTLVGHLAESESTRSVQLLICHPDNAYNDYQKRRILEQISALSHSIDIEAAKNMGLKIKCYERPASLRGRKSDDELVVFGWYTYYRKPQVQNPKQIWGAENPVVFAFMSHPHGKTMGDWFDKMFDEHWNAAVPGQQAFSMYRSKWDISDEWLNAVNSKSTSNLESAAP